MLKDVSEYVQERKGFWHEPGGQGTSEAIALESWAKITHGILEQVAADYHAVVREAELAERLQAESGIRTTRGPERWLAKMLAPLAHLHHRDGYPPLTALVVDRNGWVGERYDDLMRATEQLPITDPTARELDAARARLACYQWAGSAPEDGGVPAAVPRVVRSRAGGTTSGRTARGRTPRTPREPKAPARPKKVERPVAVCPSCFMAIPATGVCDNCG